MNTRSPIVSALLVVGALTGVACSHDEPRASEPPMNTRPSSGGTAVNVYGPTGTATPAMDPMGSNTNLGAPTTPGSTTYSTTGAGMSNPTGDAYGTPTAPSSAGGVGMGGSEVINPDPVRNPNPAMPVDTGVATDSTGSSGNNMGGNTTPAAPPVTRHHTSGTRHSTGSSSSTPRSSAVH